MLVLLLTGVKRHAAELTSSKMSTNDVIQIRDVICGDTTDLLDCDLANSINHISLCVRTALLDRAPSLDSITLKPNVNCTAAAIKPFA